MSGYAEEIEKVYMDGFKAGAASVNCPPCGTSEAVAISAIVAASLGWSMVVIGGMCVGFSKIRAKVTALYDATRRVFGFDADMAADNEPPPEPPAAWGCRIM